MPPTTDEKVARKKKIHVVTIVEVLMVDAWLALMLEYKFHYSKIK